MKKRSWKAWTIGLAGGFVSGVAQGWLIHAWAPGAFPLREAMMVAVVAGVKDMALYLSKHPITEMLEETVETVTVVETGDTKTTTAEKVTTTKEE